MASLERALSTLLRIPLRAHTAPVTGFHILDDPPRPSPQLTSWLQIPFLRSLARYLLPFLDVRAQ